MTYWVCVCETPLPSGTFPQFSYCAISQTENERLVVNLCAFMNQTIFQVNGCSINDYFWWYSILESWRNIPVSIRDTSYQQKRKAKYLLDYLQNGMYLVGGSVGFYNGNIKFLFEDMRVLKPTIMPSVPRLLNRIYEKEMETVNPWFFKRIMHNMALRSKEKEIKKFGLSTTPIIGSGIQFALPDRNRVIVIIAEASSEGPVSGINWYSARCKRTWADG